MTSLTNDELEKYLERNDVVFIPCGTIEMHGTMPMDVEYTVAEALAYKLAEDCDGLVLPHLAFFHPGATTIGRGTIYMSMTDGIYFLNTICRSLIRQGFRRLILLSAHGPSFQTIMPFITQFFDETKIPLFHGDLFLMIEDAGMDNSPEGNVSDMFIGAYKIMGRLHEVPLATQVDASINKPDPDNNTCLPDFMQDLMPSRAGSYYTAWYYGEKAEHGAMEGCFDSFEELERHAANGVRAFNELIKRLNFKKKLDSLRALDLFTQNVILPKYGTWLPENK